MQQRPLDVTGIGLLTGFAIFFAFNQVVIKWTNLAVSPVFMAGIRSAGAAVVIGLWIWLDPRVGWPKLRYWRAGLGLGVWFTIEFFALFLSLDYTSVSRVAIYFYTMPIWVALLGHFILPDDRLTPYKVLGLVLAFGGVVISLWGNKEDFSGAFLGDMLALLGGFAWAVLAIIAKSSDLGKEPPTHALWWQLLISGPIFLITAPIFGPVIRQWDNIYLYGFFFHIFLVASGGFLMWFWLLKRYSASTVASFSFISPIASVGFGVYLLNEPFSIVTIAALVLVCAGLYMVNKRPKPFNNAKQERVVAKR